MGEWRDITGAAGPDDKASNGARRPEPAAPVVTLLPEDRVVAAEAYARLVRGREELGAERERYLSVRRRFEAELEAEYARHEAELYQGLVASSQEYESVVRAFASKYIQQAGKYNFRPDLGAFVVAEEEQSS